ncbi:MAG TPA: HEAT repeat domain-containing protein, partial [Gemmatimonadales bacterium]|nr:HEAT repeat domain-containing protein [Gemmatimonadales bacterium]
MEISEVAQDLLNGKDFLGNVRRLETNRREAILYLLSVLGTPTDARPGPGVHPVDWSEAALSAISELGKKDVRFLVGLLLDGLHSPTMHPAFPLAWVLAHLDTRQAVEPLMKAVEHRDKYVRWAACTGLGRLRSKRARPLLNAAAADRSSMVRHCAVEALKSI